MYDRYKEPPNNPGNYIYVIYENPPAHPGKVVVRVWSICEFSPGEWGPVSGPAFVADTLEQARSYIPNSFMRAGLNVDPDAKISEVYI